MAAQPLPGLPGFPRGMRGLQAWAGVLGVRLRLPGLGESGVPGTWAPEGSFPHRTAKLWRLGPKIALEKKS